MFGVGRVEQSKNNGPEKDKGLEKDKKLKKDKNSTSKMDDLRDIPKELMPFVEYNFVRSEHKHDTPRLKNSLLKDLPDGTTRLEVVQNAVGKIKSKGLLELESNEERIKKNNDLEPVIKGLEESNRKLKEKLDFVADLPKIYASADNKSKLDEMLKKHMTSSKSSPLMSGCPLITEGENSQLYYITKNLQEGRSVAVTFQNTKAIPNSLNTRENEWVISVKEKGEDIEAVAFFEAVDLDNQQKHNTKVELPLSSLRLDEQSSSSSLSSAANNNQGASSKIPVPSARPLTKKSSVSSLKSQVSSSQSTSSKPPLPSSQSLTKKGSVSSLKSQASSNQGTLSIPSLMKKGSANSLRSQASRYSTDNLSLNGSILSVQSIDDKSTVSTKKKWGRKIAFFRVNHDNPENSQVLTGSVGDAAYKNFTRIRRNLTQRKVVDKQSPT